MFFRTKSLKKSRCKILYFLKKLHQKTFTNIYKRATIMLVIRKSEGEVKEMEKTMKIEGMMCGHCEARVKKCLEALPQVEEAIVSHKDGTAVVTLAEALDDAVLKKTVEDQDYEVISIK